MAKTSTHPFLVELDTARRYNRLGQALYALRLMSYGIGLTIAVTTIITAYRGRLSGLLFLTLIMPLVIVTLMRLAYRAALWLQERRLSEVFDKDLSALAERVRGYRGNVSFKEQRQTELSIFTRALLPPCQAPLPYTFFKDRSDSFDRAELQQNRP